MDSECNKYMAGSQPAVINNEYLEAPKVKKQQKYSDLVIFYKVAGLKCRKSGKNDSLYKIPCHQIDTSLTHYQISFNANFKSINGF